jgi:hypothetical protein
MTDTTAISRTCTRCYYYFLKAHHIDLTTVTNRVRLAGNAN